MEEEQLLEKKSFFNPVPQLVGELSLPDWKIAAVIKLFSEGNTVPFISRYRKEATGELDEVQIRAIQERHGYLVELEERRQAILGSIEKQGKMTDELRMKILAATTKAALEDLYLPYKPKRRTRATIARERGLEPLSDRILAQAADGDPMAEAQAFVDPEKEVPDAQSALSGARDIVAEVLSERAEVRAMVRQSMVEEGQLAVEVLPDKKGQITKFEQYYNHREAVASIPSHRFLAIRRGERENVLKAGVEVDADKLVGRVLDLAGFNPRSPFAGQMQLAASDSFERLIAPGVETDVRLDVKERSDRTAVDVFASNLRNLLMSAPLGERPVIGVDPGIRTGCKCAVMDATGKFLENLTLYLSRSDAERHQAASVLLALVKKHKPAAIAVGNGTAGRETEAFVRDVLKDGGVASVMVVSVSEAGASVYSASELAGKEFPELDVTVRGAISIARRLQDPLAELVKIDPKAIGVGQYQHDVHQPLLAKMLDEVVESCVNNVGVELNTASAPLLARVAGIGPSVAGKILKHREKNGAFHSREQLLQVSGLGPATFKQAAGFIRVRGGEHPLDASAVHPERYLLVAGIAKDLQVAIQELVGNTQLAERIDAARYVSDDVGLPTLRDIIAELKKPGRDPRQTFEPTRFRDDVRCIQDLKEGMELEGIVTNVTNFGAFVDVGVHRDGLVHISELSDNYVKDPQEVVKVGDRIRVRVLEADVSRDRIALTAKSPGAAARKKPAQDAEGESEKRSSAPGAAGRKGPPRGRERTPPPQGGKPDPEAALKHNPFASLIKKG